MNKITKQKALHAHSWVGVFLSVLLYLVCLSGTVAVFHLEFERWEQPHIEEMQSVTPDAVNKAMNRFLDKHPEDTKHLYAVFPTSDIPRLVVENDNESYFATQKGELIEKESVSFTEMLVDLHLYLHLPKSWGMILVSALGALICTLVITGIIAHKRIAKDAFALRKGGNRQQYKIDLHNRFGLWASPFHLIIGVTGTYFGMAGIILVTVAQLNYNGDRDAVVEQVFTPDPVIAPQSGKADIAKAFSQMDVLAPEKSPIFLTVHEVGTPQQFIEIYAKAPQKMIYAEGYRFDSNGDFIGVAGYENGEWGKQVIWSMYRLHFGDFAGLTSKWLYFVFGVMLTILCVSGMEIWLSKKAYPVLPTRLWHSAVWGSISALSFTAVVDMYYEGSLTAVFWCFILLNTLAAAASARFTKSVWLLISALSVLCLLVAYGVTHGKASFTVSSLQLNIPLTGYVVWAFYRSFRLRHVQA